MRPVRVEFQAFGPYVGHESVDFEAIAEKGLFLICGKTGIGKTTILDAMTFALYGKSSGHSRDDFESMRCTNADFNTTTFVKFEFENNGDHYIFERRLERKRKNLSASYNLMKKDKGGAWQVLLENAKEKALNEKAAEIIGLEYEQFSQVIVLPQGKFEKLLTSNSDEKEKILTSIFGEDKWQRIADQLYREADERRTALKEKKDMIANSLNEEHCGSIKELDKLVADKEADLEKMDREYASAEYEKQEDKLRDLLAVANRFENLHEAENKLKGLIAKKADCEAWEKSVDDAVRANKVRELLEGEKEARNTLDLRKRAENAAKEAADAGEKEAGNAAEKLKRHNEKAPAIEEKKTRKIQYEAKRADYEKLDKAVSLVDTAKNAETKARNEENKAKSSLDAIGAEIGGLQKEYEKLGSEHQNLLSRYLAGITGVIADQLVDGEPCPVCGSTTHPHKAVKADDNVTKDMVDKKKKAADAKYGELQEMMKQQEKAKADYDKKHALAEEKHNEVVGAQTSLAGIQKNLVEGLPTLTALESEIKKLSGEIVRFDADKSKLEGAEKAAREAFATAKAKVEPAENETRQAREKLDNAVNVAQKGLEENKLSSEAQAEALMLETKEIEKLRQKASDYKAAVKAAQESIDSLKKDLEGKTEPDKKNITEEQKTISDKKLAYAKDRGILEGEIKRLKVKKDRLEIYGDGIEDKIHQAEEDFTFAKKLRGDSGTGLQRYVLGVMFSSVVAAANKMLEMVHGGRYRLFRSDDKAQGTNKRGLELKVFDKNSEEHEGRFVSTLSGGEKFLASLALSIGMSTVAQKSGIKIEALFIDEGFGSLDEESIDDAMNVLNSIQEANGLVGIISHVQILQDRIPTKLRVEKIERGSHIVQTIG